MNDKTHPLPAGTPVKRGSETEDSGKSIPFCGGNADGFAGCGKPIPHGKRSIKTARPGQIIRSAFFRVLAKLFGLFVHLLLAVLEQDLEKSEQLALKMPR